MQTAIDIISNVTGGVQDTISNAMSAATTIKWDIDRLNEQINALKSNQESLEQNRTLLAGTDDKVREAWQSIAGGTFGELMEIDLENFDNAINLLSKLIEDLSSVVNNCYIPCEQEISRIVNQLASNN